MATIERPVDAAPAPAGHAAGRGLAVRRLTLADFRCYAHQRLDVDAGLVVLTGPNGAGKTNLLEALSFLVPGRGLRHAALADVGRRELDDGDGPVRPWAVAATVVTARGRAEIGTGFEAGPSGRRDKRLVHVDGETAKSQAVLAEYLSVQWLTPQMDRLFQDGPPSRRRFLDRLVFGSDTAHLGRVNAYEHAMRQRLKLLRDGAADAAWLTALEDTMAAKGVAVAAARRDVARRLGEHLSAAAGDFPGAAIEVRGTIENWLAEGPALEAEDRFRARLGADRDRDRADGRTQTGPHRSDLAVHLAESGREAAVCSTGEQKALLVALVLATARMRAHEQRWAPLLLLDEVAAHLDGDRLAALFAEVADLGAQVWFAGTDAGLFRGLRGRAQFFEIADGAVRPAA